jgi:hypothetical protein
MTAAVEIIVKPTGEVLQAPDRGAASMSDKPQLDQNGGVISHTGI